MSPAILCLFLLSQAAEPVVPAPPQPDTADLSGRVVILSVDDGYHSTYTNIYPLLRKYGMTMTLGVVVGKVGKGSPSYQPSERFLNQAEIREMVDSIGMEVASHSISHTYLTKVDSARAWLEIAGSKWLLESLFGTPVITFVYPYGKTNDRVRRWVQQAGYQVARAVRPGNPSFGLDPYRIPEIELRDSTSLARIQSYIRRHRVTVLLLHKVVPQPKAFTEYSSADFARLVGWLHARRVQVTTLGEQYRTWWRRKLTRELMERLAVLGEERGRRLFEHVDVDATGAEHPR